MKKLSILFFSIVSVFTFYQCQTDIIDEVPIDDPIVVVGETIEVDADITSDVTWVSGNTYVLQDMIAVKDNATLTIESCVVIKAANGATGLIITQEGTIDAQGTSECPIIFTSTEDLLEPGEIVSPNLTEADQGLWGGIFILGDAPVSSIFSSNILPLIALDWDLYFGGETPNDNSGTLQYVSIRHTGFETAPYENPASLNLGGVGSGTTINNVELFANVDDGMKILGGTVNLNNVIAVSFDDDAFDLDIGFGGTLNNIIATGGSNNDSALELDGGEGAENPSFTIMNASFKGSQAGENYIDFQNNVNCTIENTYFFGFDADALVKLDADEDADNWENELIDVVNLEFNTSHLSSGNTTIETIFMDAGNNGNDAFSNRIPNASIVVSPTVGANKSVFSDWTISDQTGVLDDF